MAEDLNLKKPHARRRLSMGAISLMLLVVNAATVFWAAWAVGNGVDSGIGFFYLLSAVTFPLFIVALVLAVISVVRKKGYIPGAITVVISLGALAWAVYSFLESQVL